MEFFRHIFEFTIGSVPVGRITAGVLLVLAALIVRKVIERVFRKGMKSGMDSFPFQLLHELARPAGSFVILIALTLAVAMVQDPFNALRANGSYNFGRTVMSAEDIRSGATLVHEMGHAIGSLEDEYIYEFYNIPLDYEPEYANATIESDPTRAKWADLIEPGTPVPTPTNYEGYGLFEGLSIFHNGAYRPTETSMMRNTDYPFFEVNARQLRKVLSQFR